MSKNRRCPTLAFESEPGFNHAMFPQTASPHGSNLTCTFAIIPRPDPEDTVCKAGARGQQEHRQG
jgi:hypothetical protein